MPTSFVNLTPPPQVPFYRGISVFEPRLNGKEIHIQSDGNMSMAGALYLHGESDLRPGIVYDGFLASALCVADLAEMVAKGNWKHHP